MPEVLTKYPDVVLDVLRGGGAQCGPGQEQRILTKCPPARFCSTPTGETCVYGLDEIPRMTQLSVGELAERVCSTAAGRTASCSLPAGPADVRPMRAPTGTGSGAALLVGVGVLLALRRVLRARRSAG